MSAEEEFRPSADTFDKLYRGEPAFDGAPAPTAIPWDVRRAQPRLMELEALGAISGEVLDIGCGLGDNAIFLASRGYSVTALDGSPAAIEQARERAAAAGATVTFGVADATNLTGYDGRFDTVIDSALLHCLDDAGRHAYAAGIHRATRAGARWFLYTFSDDNVNGIIAPMDAVGEAALRDVLTRHGWHVDFTGPTTYLGDPAGFTGPEELPPTMLDQLPPGHLDRLARMRDRFAAITPWLDGHQVHLPFVVVHATRVD
ncbi:MAG: class I SAM-dependent methyltransferase [Mycobacterium sp.]